MKMKRKIFIIMFAAAIALSLYGCSKADIEKNPVKIEDSNTNLNATVLDEDINENEKQNTELADKTLNESSATDNAENNAVKTAKETTSETESKITAAKLELEGQEVDLKVEIEGSTQIVKGKIHVSETGYQMAYDPERFELYRKLDDVDNYKAKNKDLFVYPYVFLNGSRCENTTVKDYAKKLEKDASRQMISFHIRQIEGGLEPYNKTYIRIGSGTRWDSPIREYYFFEDGNDILLIETQYYVEAEKEGYGAIFSAMIDTFEIL